MAAFIYTAREMLAWLLFLAILFGAVLFVVVAGILLDEGRRSTLLRLKSCRQGLSAPKRSSLHPVMNPGGG
jgi:threonine/homoserine/homoserine lactone efflux protein